MAGNKQVKHKAVFLVFSLWIFIFLAIFCLSLGFRTYISVRKTKLVLNRVRAQGLAVSGVNIARSILTQTDLTCVNAGQDWAREITESIKFNSPPQEGFLRIIITDESSRININIAPKVLLEKIFKGLDLSDSLMKVDSFLYYISENVKNEPLAILEEITLAENITYEDYKKIKDFFTTFVDDAKVNVNTATPELLEMIVDSPSTKTLISSPRFGSNPGYFQENELSSMTEVDLLKASSNCFRVMSEANVGGVIKKITCVLKLGSGIIYWHEE